MGIFNDILYSFVILYGIYCTIFMSVLHLCFIQTVLLKLNFINEHFVQYTVHGEENMMHVDGKMANNNTTGNNRNLLFFL